MDNTPKSELLEFVEEIFQKFPDELDDYEYLENVNSLCPGESIRYVDLHLNKMGFGIVGDLKRDKNQKVILITFLNANKNGGVWKINPKQYYFFHLYGSW